MYPVYLPRKLILPSAFMLLIHCFLHLAFKVFYDFLNQLPALRGLLVLEAPSVSHSCRTGLQVAG